MCTWKEEDRGQVGEEAGKGEEREGLGRGYATANVPTGLEAFLIWLHHFAQEAGWGTGDLPENAQVVRNLVLEEVEKGALVARGGHDTDCPSWRKGCGDVRVLEQRVRSQGG